MIFSLLIPLTTQRCDAAKPICGPCADHPKEDPCEYQDAKVRSRYQHLEDTIKELQERLAEHESPQQSAPPVLLQNPYAGPSSAPSTSLVHLPGSGEIATPISPFSNDVVLAVGKLSQSSYVGNNATNASLTDSPANVSVSTAPNVNVSVNCRPCYRPLESHIYLSYRTPQ